MLPLAAESNTSKENKKSHSDQIPSVSHTLADPGTIQSGDTHCTCSYKYYRYKDVPNDCQN